MKLKRLFAATIAVLFLLPAVPAAAISTKRIEAVSFSNATTGYMVGGSYLNPGFLSVTNDGGATWSAVNVGLPTYAFKSVGASPSGAWTFSEFEAFPYITVGGAGIWNPGASVGTYTPRIADITVLADGRLVAVGEKTEAPDTRNPALIVTSDNQGASWQTRFEGPAYPPTFEEDPYTATLAKLLAVDAAGSTVYAAGNEFTPGSGADGSTTSLYSWRVYRSTNGGSTWTTGTTPVDASGRPVTTGYPVTSVAALSANVAYAAGYNRVLLKTTNGVSWSNVIFPRTPTSQSIYANDIAAADANTVVAVGAAASADGAGLIGINRSAVSGNTWTYVYKSSAPLRDVEILDADSWIVVGDNEAIYRTDDAGVNWVTISSGLAGPVVTITNPAGTFPLTLAPIEFAGTTADAGVGAVSTEIRIRRADGKTWNGVDDWTSAEIWLPVDSATDLRTWSYTWTTNPNAVLHGQIVTVSARGADAMANSSLSTNSISSGVPITASVSLAGGAQYTTQSTVTAALSVSSPVAKMRYKVGAGAYGAWINYASSTSVNLGAGDGTKVVTFEFGDGISAVTSASDSIDVHTSIPAVSITSPTSGFVVADPLTVSGSASDVGGSVSKVEVLLRRANGDSWNGSAWVVGDHWRAAASSNGYATWNLNESPLILPGQAAVVIARAYDHTGLMGTSTTVDSNLPLGGGSVSLNGGASFTTTTAVTASLQVSGAATHMRYRLDGGAPTGWIAFAPTWPITLSGGDGTKSVTFEFSTDGTNADPSATSTDTIVLHTSYPAIEITTPVEGFSLSTPLTISGTASDAGGTVDRVEVRVRRSDGLTWNGSAWAAGDTWLTATGTSNWTLIEEQLQLTDLIVSVTVRAYDQYDLEAVTDGISSTSVSAAVSLAGGAQYTTTPTTRADISAAPPAAKMRWRVNSGAYSSWVGYAATADVALGSDGPKTVDFEFGKDDFSVVARASDDTVLDSTPPSASFSVAPTGDYPKLASIPMTISSADTLSGVASVRMRIMRDGQYWNGASWQAAEFLIATNAAGTGSWTYTWVPDAETKAAYRPVTFTAVADDVAGNRRLSSVVTLDPVDPVTLASSLTPSITSYGTYAVVKGTLTGPLGAVSGRPVELWYKSYVTGSVWKKSSTVRTTGADGSVSWSVKPYTKTYYETRHVAGSGYAAATDWAGTVDPKVSMTAPRNKYTVKKGRTYTWYGYIKPKHTSGSTAAYLRFYRYKNGKYVYYKTVKAKAIYYSSTTTKYSARTSLPYTGKWRVRAYHDDAGHAETFSSYLYKRVY